MDGLLSGLTSFTNALPGAVSQGLIWGIMAIGLFITYKLLELSDLTVDGSFCTGGAACVMLMLAGCNVWVAMLGAMLMDKSDPELRWNSLPMQAKHR